MSATKQNELRGSLAPLAGYFSQLGYVVTDLDAAVNDLSDSLGVSFTRRASHEDTSGVRYRGRPTDPKVIIAFADLRGIELEIIQPVSANNFYTDYLEQRGPGLHHAGFRIPEMQQFTAYYELMVKNGNVPLMEGRVEGDFRVEFCYFDCSAFGASFIELTHFF